MSLMIRLHLHEAKCMKFWQYREYASVYTKTLNLPSTKFPAYVKKTKRAEHDKNIREKFLKPLYQWQRKNLVGKEFILHDGPPYANGDVHMGHAVNKIAKDFILRFNIMNRKRVHYVPGWDCHGLPIESKAKSIKEGMSPLEIRNNARKFATETMLQQKKEFESWGVTADWNSRNNVYRTYDASYIKNQLNLFYELYEKKLIFRDFKPVYYSPSSRTALAEAELEYDKNHVSPSLYIRMKLCKKPAALKSNNMPNNIFALIWTTTPWTLPANQAICFSVELKYSLIKINNSLDGYIVASNLIPSLKEALNTCEIEEICSVPDDVDLEQCTYFHPIDKDVELPFFNGSHVTADVGTGLVHTAPAHGFDDHLIALSKSLPIKCVVDQFGRYSKNAPDFLQGKEVADDGNPLCLDRIKDDTIQLSSITHSYPIDWRTKKPVIINATHQWFINIEDVRDAALSEIGKINIYTSTSSEKRKDNQLSQKIQQRPYWCISRQRVWGTPIPVFYRKDTDEPILTKSILDNLHALLEKNGNIDYWWQKDVKDLIPDSELKQLNLSADQIAKGNDILDIWFDSGISWSFALDPPNVADLYLEGYDQFTGWFQSSLITSVAARGIAPYKHIFVHGFTVDESGTKMSKSLGNVIHPKEIIENHNVDSLRWWVASHLVGQASIPVKPSLLEDSAKAVQETRKLLRYFVGFADKMPPPSSLNTNKYHINYDQLDPLDKYILNSLAKFEQRVQSLAAGYRFPMFMNNINKYLNDDLSAFYVDVIKDKLYIGSPSDYTSVLKVLCAQFCIVCKSLWPIVPHLIEESWSYYSKTEPFYKSTFVIPAEWHNTEFDEVMKLTKHIIGNVRENITKTTWYFDVVISANDEQLKQLYKLHPTDGKVHNDSHLCEILQVQSVQLCQSNSSELSITKKEVAKSLCERCRRFTVPSPNMLCLRCERVISQS